VAALASAQIIATATAGAETRADTLSVAINP
jgi:hypothetical protein